MLADYYLSVIKAHIKYKDTHIFWPLRTYYLLHTTDMPFSSIVFNIKNTGFLQGFKLFIYNM